MKVALVTAFPADVYAPHGGVEAVSVCLTDALSRLPDLEVHVVTMKSCVSAASVWRWGSVLVHVLPAQSRRVLVNAVGRGRRYLQYYLHELGPDVVHAHDQYGIMTIGMCVPRVFTVHGFIQVDTAMEGGWGAWLRAALWRRLECRAWAEQPHIIAISPYVRERLSGIARGQVHEVENPIGEAFFGVARDEHQGTVFSASHLSPLKNTLGLIEAFARVCRVESHARLRLAGSGDDRAYCRRIGERIRELGLEERVTLLGKVSAGGVMQELSRASVFCLVSLQENAPVCISEAMAAGVPVVTSNRCGMPYMVQDDCTGFLVDPLNCEEIATRLVQLLRSRELRVRMGRLAHEVAADRFHPTAVAERTVDVYRRALREGQDHRAHPCTGR